MWHALLSWDPGAVGLVIAYLGIGQFYASQILSRPVNMRHSPVYWPVVVLSVTALTVAWPVHLALRASLRGRR